MDCELRDRESVHQVALAVSYSRANLFGEQDVVTPEWQDDVAVLQGGPGYPTPLAALPAREAHKTLIESPHIEPYDMGDSAIMGD